MRVGGQVWLGGHSESPAQGQVDESTRAVVITLDENPQAPETSPAAPHMCLHPTSPTKQHIREIAKFPWILPLSPALSAWCISSAVN